jgi:tRNA (guanosine-2'-O-)-methyltransferase
MIEKKILAEFYQLITDNKKQLFDQISSQRTRHVTVVVENVYQEHNASAILRSCDCFGIQELHVIEKNNQYKVQRDIALGAGRWVDLFNYNKGNSVTLDCLSKLKTRGYKIIATSPYATESIFDIDISEPMAFVFGTEREGISDVVKENADSFVQIPMYGFTESFNISVSVAILLTTIRQRLESSDFYWKLTSEEQIILKNKWCKKILNGGESMEKLFREKHS